MRLLVLHSQLGTLRGGGENFSRNLFSAFVALGHEVRAAFVADRMGRYPFPLPAGIEPIPVPGWWSEAFGQAALSAVGRRLAGHESLRRKWDYAQSALAWRTFRWNGSRFQRRVLCDLARTIDAADAVYVHSNAVLANEVSKRRPTVLRLPGPLAADAHPVLRRIHAVCANGDALVRMRAFMGERVLELPVGLDADLFSPGESPIRARLGWRSDERVIGYVGRLAHIKGVDLLADGFRLLAQRDRSVKLLVVGSGEETRNLRRTLAAQMQSGAVHLAGDVPHDDLPAYYRAMDVLVMPSRYENYSNAVLEGLACRVPFVGSDVGGNRALSEIGAGWLFPSESAAALAVSLERALTDQADRICRGEEGRRYVRERFDWMATARRLEAIVSSVVTGSAARSAHDPLVEPSTSPVAVNRVAICGTRDA